MRIHCNIFIAETVYVKDTLIGVLEIKKPKKQISFASSNSDSNTQTTSSVDNNRAPPVGAYQGGQNIALM